MAAVRSPIEGHVGKPKFPVFSISFEHRGALDLRPGRAPTPTRLGDPGRERPFRLQHPTEAIRPPRRHPGHSSHWLEERHLPSSVAMDNTVRTVARRSRFFKARWESLFFRLFLPIGVVANLVIGVLILTGLKPQSWSDWLQVSTGAFCCVVAGWLAAAAWSKAYWNRAMTRQVTVWRKIADTFFVWLEDAPVPAEALTQLKTSLDEAVPSGERR